MNDVHYYQINKHGRQRIRADNDADAVRIARANAAKYPNFDAWEHWRLVKETSEVIAVK